ncbi:aminotransferase class I/II-fold pyridoxal phosphate-dependent enzyme [Deinococcus lacus]|uniref:Aminotransferase class I/II-fold pyridoxal phosphate-dependent enzyme n=1 Tax=Deinococcus lacus TaxID=392561 RepID=A0ABW1YI58_9DEIO
MRELEPGSGAGGLGRSGPPAFPAAPAPGWAWLGRAGGQRLRDFASNDYLGLAATPLTPERAWAVLSRSHLSGEERSLVLGACQQFGAGGSRLITGHHPVHELLERELARVKGTESALVFGSGYQTNLGLLTALLGPQDALFQMN